MDPTWRDRAACLGKDPDLFFPDGSKGVHRLQVREAKAVCAECPVRAECLDDALNTNRWVDAYGIRAGLDPEQRRTLRKLRNRNAAREGDTR